MLSGLMILMVSRTLKGFVDLHKTIERMIAVCAVEIAIEFVVILILIGAK